jgi:hypothetical protein
MSDVIPPSASLLPPASALRARLAVALREVDLLRRLIRAVESVHPFPVTTADQLYGAAVANPAADRGEGAHRGT